MFGRVSGGRGGGGGGGAGGNRQVCKFYLEGRCKFGDNCNYDHPPRQGGNQGGNQGGFGTQNRGGGGFGGGNQSNHQGGFGNQNRGGPAGGGGNRNNNSTNNRDEAPYLVSAKGIQLDLTEGEDRPSWPLSSYGPGRDAPRQLIEGANEMSPEEMRVLCYLAVEQGNLPEYQQGEQLKVNDANQQVQKILDDLDGAVRYVISAKDQHPNRVDQVTMNAPAFRYDQNFSGQPIGNQFSGFGNGAGFGAPSQTQTSSFGQPSSIGGGASSFGQPSTVGGGGSGFGQPAKLGSGGSSFGQPSALGGGGSAFGQPSKLGSSTSPFGATITHPSTSSSPFGQLGNTGQQQTGSGQTATQASPFGQPAQQTSVFGQRTSPAQQQSNFGQPSRQNNPFGQPSQPAQPQSVFGQPSQPQTQSVFGAPSQPNKQPGPFVSASTPSSGFGQQDQAPSQPQRRDQNQAPSSATPGEPPTLWNNMPVQQRDGLFYYTDQQGQTVRIWHPLHPPGPRPDAEAPPEVYANPPVAAALKGMYEYARDYGEFKDGLVPEVPPLQIWAGQV